MDVTLVDLLVTKFYRLSESPVTTSRQTDRLCPHFKSVVRSSRYGPQYLYFLNPFTGDFVAGGVGI